MRRLRARLRRLLRLQPKTVGTVTVTLTADTTAYVDAIERLRESTSNTRYRLRVRRERALGLAYVNELLDEWRRELGIDREETRR